jgi:hypothetical protein
LLVWGRDKMKRKIKLSKLQHKIIGGNLDYTTNVGIMKIHFRLEIGDLALMSQEDKSKVYEILRINEDSEKALTRKVGYVEYNLTLREHREKNPDFDRYAYPDPKGSAIDLILNKK